MRCVMNLQKKRANCERNKRNEEKSIIKQTNDVDSVKKLI